MLLLLPVAYYGMYLALRVPAPEEPQLIAHRGGSVDTPENTLAAFENAVAYGADWLEMDVQRTSDGELVVIHDETVDRTTNGTGRVRDLTYAEIRALDAGEGQSVPSFVEVIALAREAGVGLLPEAKSPHLYPALEVEMVDALNESGYQGQAIIQSFDHDTLVAAQSHDPQAQLCPLFGLTELGLGQTQPSTAAAVCPSAEKVILIPWIVRQAHRDHRRVFVWFRWIEHPLSLRLLLALGVDGLMVDDPAQLANVLER